MLSQGIPMVLAGDELGRTQQGNNNAYCQDNEINWLDWNEDALYADELPTFLASLTDLRKRFPMLAYDKFIHNNDPKSAVKITWLHNTGNPMQKDNWHSHNTSTLGYLVQGVEQNSPSILCIFHASEFSTEFTLPELEGVSSWDVVVDTSRSAKNETLKLPAERVITLQPYSTTVLLNE